MKQENAIESEIIKVTSNTLDERPNTMKKIAGIIGNFWVGYGAEVLPLLIGHVSTVTTLIDRAFLDFELFEAY